MTTIEEVFGEEGILAGHLKGYEVRPGQIELARAIDRSVEESRFLMAEGPTGIGKSYAYLVPVILDLASKKIKKAVLATANIALQEQLIEKDLPALERMMPERFTYGLLKGRNNYLCRHKLDEFRQGQLSMDEMYETKQLLAWVERTRTGDKSELSFETKRWRMLSSGAGECLGSKCPHSGNCYANIARWAAIDTDVVVCNYHILLTASTLIPDHDVLICDEAHDLEDVARSALGWKVNQWTFRNIANWVRPHQGEQAGLAQRITTAAEVLFDDVKNALGRWDNFRLETPNWAHGMDALLELLKRASTVAARVANSTDNEIEEARAESMGGIINETINQLHQAKALENEDWVYWLTKEKGPPERFYIQGAPIMVNEVLPEALYGGLRSALFLSATMTSGNSFEFIREQLGIPSDAGELIAPSPFDLKEQGILVVPKDMPPPDTRDRAAAEDFYDAVADYALELINVCGGRTLLLFTSWRSLNHVYKNLMKANLPFRVLKQGHAPRTKLIEEFKQDIQSVLLGVASFWQGIDVPGEALTGLLIDKIPFPVPTDPVQAAIGDYIERNGGNPFFDRSVPHATIALSQGIGRLIRSKKDRGIVLITDNRLITKNYGNGIIRALPHLKKVRTFEKAEGFLHG